MYRTSDLGLASAIHSLGYPQTDIIRLSPKKLQFVFPEHPDVIAIEQAWYQGALTVIAPHYWGSMKLLKARIYEIQNQRS
jgi:hypothetical protein